MAKQSIQLLLLILFSSVFYGQELKKEYNTNKSNILIDGYDVVSYHNGLVKKGNKLYSLNYDNIIIHFSSPENKETFKISPKKYLPKYGGWCAYAIGDSGEKVTINPNTYKLVDGDLYLFYNKNLTNTLKLWNKNESKLKSQANKNWQLIIE